MVRCSTSEGVYRMSELVVSHPNIGRSFERSLPDGRVVCASAKLHYIAGNSSSYFSLTGKVWRSSRDLARHRRTGSEAGLEGCGMMHEAVIEAFPELAAFAAMHLSDEDGAPMHDVE